MNPSICCRLSGRDPGRTHQRTTIAIFLYAMQVGLRTQLSTDRLHERAFIVATPVLIGAIPPSAVRNVHTLETKRSGWTRFHVQRDFVVIYEQCPRQRIRRI